MNVRVGAATDIGLVREGNEDSYLVEEPLFVIADGMGGHRGGEVASRLAIETIEALFRRGQGGLAEQVQEANRAVFERSSSDRDVAGMGTTLTAALIDGDRLRLAHVGDSRAYLLRDGELRMITEDHTLVHQMVQQGEITEAEAERHPQRSIVTRALGMDATVTVDEAIVDLRPGDRLLICSDGLTSMVGDDAIAAHLGRETDPQRAAEALVAEANKGGGVDNTTVIVVAVDEDGSSAGQGEAPARRRDTLVDPASARTAGGAISSRAASRARGRTGIRWGRAAAVAAIVAAVIALALVGARAYLDTQWYVGVANGHVAIYRGIPADMAGFELHHLVLETTVPAADAERLAIYRTRLPDGITAEDRMNAEQIVEQIRSDVASQPRPSTSPKPTKDNA
ncbi:MAG TPA: Stp1/IreP family PP2C-type Ser/Thr phosphatase [Actinomycetota bacterium]|jgi:protein phosphatase